MDAETRAVQERYDRFARTETPGRSVLYGRWARAVADSADTAAILARIPAVHRQPPLVFAVTRSLGSGLPDADGWRDWLHAHADAVVAEAARRLLQTNEPLRTAALAPVLFGIEGPVALIEVGASAGLCLYPDRYSYRWHTPAGVERLDPVDGPSRVVLDAVWQGVAPPRRLPEIVWRAGVDLQPRDARDPADRAWVTGLVWPGEDGRRERVEAALDIVAADPPLLRAGDALERLPELVDAAPAGATLVVSTPGVLVHIPWRHRVEVVAAVRRAGRWASIDPAGLHDGVRGAWESAPTGAEWSRGVFTVTDDGRPVAAADPLGGVIRPASASFRWRADAGGGDAA